MKKGRSVLGRVGRIVAFVFLTPVTVLLAAMLLLAIPPVQQKAVDVAAGYLSDAVGMDICIEHAGIRLLPPDISLRGVQALERESGDTLLWVNRLLLDVDGRDLLHKVIHVKTIRLDDVTANTSDLIDGILLSGNVGELFVRSDSTVFLPGGGLNTVFNEVRLCDSKVNLELLESSAAETDTSSSSLLDWRMEVRKLTLDNVDFGLTPPELSAHVGHLEIEAAIRLADFLYDVHTLNLSRSTFSMAEETVQIEELKALAVMDSMQICVPSLHLKASESLFSADVEADLAASLNMESMLLECSGRAAAFGAHVGVEGSYHITEEAYDASVDVKHLVLSKVVSIGGEYCLFDGQIKVKGKGIDILSPAMEARTDIHVDTCLWGGLLVSDMQLSAQLKQSVLSGKTGFDMSYSDTSMAASTKGDVLFSVSRWNTALPDFTVEASFGDVNLRRREDSFSVSEISLEASTDRRSGCVGLKMPGIDLTASTAGHLLSVPSEFSALVAKTVEQYEALDFDISALKPYFPEIALNLTATPDPYLRGKMQGFGLDFQNMAVALDMSKAQGIRADAVVDAFQKDSFAVHRTTVKIRQMDSVMNCLTDVDFHEQHALPPFKTRLEAEIGEHVSDFRLDVKSDIQNGILSLTDLTGGVQLTVTGSILDSTLNAEGALDLKHFRFGQFDLEDRTVRIGLHPIGGSDRYRASAEIADFPLHVVSSIVEVPGLVTGGCVDAKFTADLDTSGVELAAELLPKGVFASMKPYGVALSLGEAPVLFRDMKVLLDGMTLYSVDSTRLSIGGTFDMERMYADITANSGEFKPADLARPDSLPISGELALGIAAAVRGPADSLTIHADLSLLPVTNITYLIDSKNSAFAKASGDLSLELAPGGNITANGIIHVPEGVIRYSPKLYPLQPFEITPDSYVRFEGDITRPVFGITATQPAKVNVTKNGVPRVVDFEVGLKVADRLDSLALEFILDAPEDREIQGELASFTDEERSTVAAAMLATGMYVTADNEAAMSSSYALTSMMQSRLNAMADNRMRNKALDIDIGVSEAMHNDVATTDYSLKLSRQFFNDRLKVTVGGRVSDKKTSNATSLIDDLQLQWQVKPKGNTYLRLFHKNDYENIIDGELQKDGLGVLFNKQWSAEQGGGTNLTLEGNYSHRSNFQIGPDVNATISKTNLFGWNETLSASIKGAYYRNYKDNSMTDRNDVDSYHTGVDVEMMFPGILVPWKRDPKSEKSGTTHIGLGYTYENIAGGYRMNEISAGITYRSHLSKYVTHSFSPFSLSVIRSAGNNLAEERFISLMKNKNLVKNLIRDEFVPSMQYSFSYNNMADRSRAVNTRFDAVVKESGNLTGGIQALFGKDFNEKGKGFIFGDYSQFVKFQIELRNRFHLTESTTLATRALLGSVISYGNSFCSPLSEVFYSGGPNSIRAFPSRSLGPGNYRSTDKSEDPYFFHGGESRIELNAEYRFPLVWMLEGAVFLEAGNVWNNTSLDSGMTVEEKQNLKEWLKAWEIDPEFNGGMDKNLLAQTALGTGFGVRFVFQSLVIRLDLGIALHAPFNTGKSGFYNIPSFWKDGTRLNFAIGYPF